MGVKIDRQEILFFFQFCRSALIRTLSDWNAVNSLITNDKDSLCASFFSSKYTVEEKHQLESQNGSARLDKFTQTLLLKLDGNEYDYLGSLLTTLSERRKIEMEDEVTEVASRFVRSVVRVYVCLTGDLDPVSMSSESHQKVSARFSKVFQELMDVSVKELCKNADALMAPVRMGAVRPVNTFPFRQTGENESKSATDQTDELFRAGPYPPRKQKTDGNSRASRRMNR